MTCKSCQWHVLEQSSKFKRAEGLPTLRWWPESVFQGFQKCTIFAQQTGPRTKSFRGIFSTPLFCSDGYGLTLNLFGNKIIGEIRTKTCISTPFLAGTFLAGKWHNSSPPLTPLTLNSCKGDTFMQGWVIQRRRIIRRIVCITYLTVFFKLLRIIRFWELNEFCSHKPPRAPQKHYQAL